VNQAEWHPLAILVAALAFALAATAIQRLLGRIVTRRGPAGSPAISQAPENRPVLAAVGPDESLNREGRTERGARGRAVPSPARRRSPLATRRRARQILRQPGGLKVAILAREILGPAKGLAGQPDQR
jgi:hypothetical protein